MNYWINRGGQQYGPYSLADLQRYVASGNILPTDLARGESMSQWVPVSQILAGGGQMPRPPAPSPQPQPSPQQAYGQAPVYSQPGAVASQPQPVPVQGGPLPPGMEWFVVLLIAIFTCGIFSAVWMFIQANFVKQIRPASNALLFYAIGIGGVFAAVFLTFARELLMLAPLVNLGCAVLIIVGHFQMKAALEDYYNTVEPIGLRLNGVMVFFFNVFYFQYHFSRIRKWKTTGVLTP
jgi:hypothetical protein